MVALQARPAVGLTVFYNEAVQYRHRAECVGINRSGKISAIDGREDVGIVVIEGTKDNRFLIKIQIAVVWAIIDVRINQNSVTIFGLDIGPFVGLGSQEDGKALIQELKITYPTGTTSDAKVVKAYRVLGMPTTVFLTPDGKVFRNWTGLLTRAKLEELIEELLRASGT